MNLTFKFTLSTLLTINLFSCKDRVKNNERLDLWYSKIKNEITENSKQKEDSISYETKGETFFITYFLKGYRIRQEYRTLDTSRLLATKGYGQNNNFELRSEIYSNGQKATEGITYKGNYFGPWTVWYDNGQIMYRGNRYENNDFGSWTYYSEKGEIQKIVDNKKPDLIDSILENKSLHTTLGFASAGGDK